MGDVVPRTRRASVRARLVLSGAADALRSVRAWNDRSTDQAGAAGTGRCHVPGTGRSHDTGTGRIHNTKTGRGHTTRRGGFTRLDNPDYGN